MANLKNKKSNVTKKTAATTVKAAPVQAAQAAVASKDAAKPEETKTTTAQKKEETVKTDTNKKAAETKTTAEKKTTAGKTATKRKTTVRRATKKPEPVQEVFYEYGGEQILTEELVNRIKETYKSEGHRVGAIKSLRVYINPEERKAYYVINDKAEGKFVEF